MTAKKTVAAATKVAAPKTAAKTTVKTAAKASPRPEEAMTGDKTAEAKPTLPAKREAAEEQFAKADAKADPAVEQGEIKNQRELDVKPEEAAAMRAVGVTF